MDCPPSSLLRHKNLGQVLGGIWMEEWRGDGVGVFRMDGGCGYGCLGSGNMDGGKGWLRQRWGKEF